MEINNRLCAGEQGTLHGAKIGCQCIMAYHSSSNSVLFIAHYYFIPKQHRWNICLVDLESSAQSLIPTSNTNFRSGNVRKTE